MKIYNLFETQIKIFWFSKKKKYLFLKIGQWRNYNVYRSIKLRLKHFAAWRICNRIERTIISDCRPETTPVSPINKCTNQWYARMKSKEAAVTICIFFRLKPDKSRKTSVRTVCEAFVWPVFYGKQIRRVTFHANIFSRTLKNML